jgi:hypothetical protein
MTTIAPTRRSRRYAEPTPARALRETLAPYITLPRLRRLVAERGDLYQALRCATPSQDVLAVLEIRCGARMRQKREGIGCFGDGFSDCLFGAVLFLTEYLELGNQR